MSRPTDYSKWKNIGDDSSSSDEDPAREWRHPAHRQAAPHHARTPACVLRPGPHAQTHDYNADCWNQSVHHSNIVNTLTASSSSNSSTAGGGASRTTGGGGFSFSKALGQQTSKRAAGAATTQKKDECRNAALKLNMDSANLQSARRVATTSSSTTTTSTSSSTAAAARTGAPDPTPTNQQKKKRNKKSKAASTNDGATAAPSSSSLGQQPPQSGAGGGGSSSGQPPGGPSGAAASASSSFCTSAADSNVRATGINSDPPQPPPPWGGSSQEASPNELESKITRRLPLLDTTVLQRLQLLDPRTACDAYWEHHVRTLETSKCWMEIMRMRKEDILAYLLASLGCNCVENRSGAAALIADASGGEPATPEAHLLLGRAVKKLPGKNNVTECNAEMRLTNTKTNTKPELQVKTKNTFSKTPLAGVSEEFLRAQESLQEFVKRPGFTNAYGTLELFLEDIIAPSEHTTNLFDLVVCEILCASERGVYVPASNKMSRSQGGNKPRRLMLRDAVSLLLSKKSCRAFRFPALCRLGVSAYDFLRKLSLLPDAMYSDRQLRDACERWTLFCNGLLPSSASPAAHSTDEVLENFALEFLTEEEYSDGEQLKKARSSLQKDLCALLELVVKCGISSTGSDASGSGNDGSTPVTGAPHHSFRSAVPAQQVPEAVTRVMCAAVRGGIHSLRNLLVFVEQVHAAGFRSSSAAAQVGVGHTDPDESGLPDEVWRVLARTVVSSNSKQGREAILQVSCNPDELEAMRDAAPVHDRVANEDGGEDNDSASERSSAGSRSDAYESAEEDYTGTGKGTAEISSPSRQGMTRLELMTTCRLVGFVGLNANALLSSSFRGDQQQQVNNDKTRRQIYYHTCRLPLLVRFYHSPLYRRRSFVTAPTARKRFDALLAQFVEDELLALVDVHVQAAGSMISAADGGTGSCSFVLDEQALAEKFWLPLLNLICDESYYSASIITSSSTSAAPATGGCEDFLSQGKVGALQDPVILFHHLCLVAAQRAVSSDSCWLLRSPDAVELLLRVLLTHEGFCGRYLAEGCELHSALRIGALIEAAVNRLRKAALDKDNDRSGECAKRWTVRDATSTTTSTLSSASSSFPALRPVNIFLRVFDAIGGRTWLAKNPRGVHVFLPLLCDHCSSSTDRVHTIDTEAKQIDLEGNPWAASILQFAACRIDRGFDDTYSFHVNVDEKALCEILSAEADGERVGADVGDEKQQVGEGYAVEQRTTTSLRRRYQKCTKLLVAAATHHCKRAFPADCTVTDRAASSSQSIYSEVSQLTRACACVVDAWNSKKGKNSSWRFVLEVVVPKLDTLIRICLTRLRFVSDFLQKNDLIKALRHGQAVEETIRSIKLRAGVHSMLQSGKVIKEHQMLAASNHPRAPGFFGMGMSMLATEADLPVDAEAEPIFALMSGDAEVQKALAQAVRDYTEDRSACDVSAAYSRLLASGQIAHSTGMTSTGTSSSTAGVKLLSLLCTHAAVAVPEDSGSPEDFFAADAQNVDVQEQGIHSTSTIHQLDQGQVQQLDHGEAGTVDDDEQLRNGEDTIPLMPRSQSHRHQQQQQQTSPNDQEQDGAEQLLRPAAGTVQLQNSSDSSSPGDGSLSSCSAEEQVDNIFNKQEPEPGGGYWEENEQKRFFADDGFAFGRIVQVGPVFWIKLWKTSEHKETQQYLQNHDFFERFWPELNKPAGAPAPIDWHSPPPPAEEVDVELWCHFRFTKVDVARLPQALQRNGVFVQFKIHFQRGLSYTPAHTAVKGKGKGKSAEEQIPYFYAIENSIKAAPHSVIRVRKWISSAPPLPPPLPAVQGEPHHQQHAQQQRQEQEAVETAAPRSWATLFDNMARAREEFRQHHDGRLILGKMQYRAPESAKKYCGFVSPLRESLPFPEVLAAIGKHKHNLQRAAPGEHDQLLQQEEGQPTEGRQHQQGLGIGRAAQCIHIDLKSLAKHARLEPMKGDVVSFALNESSDAISKVLSGRSQYLSARDLNVVRYNSTVTSSTSAPPNQQAGPSTAKMRGIRHFLKLLGPVYSRTASSSANTGPAASIGEREFEWYQIACEFFGQFEPTAQAHQESDGGARDGSRAPAINSASVVSGPHEVGSAGKAGSTGMKGKGKARAAGANANAANRFDSVENFEVHGYTSSEETSDSEDGEEALSALIASPIPERQRAVPVADLVEPSGENAASANSTALHVHQQSQAELELLQKTSALSVCGDSGVAFFRLCVEELLREFFGLDFQFPLTAAEEAEAGGASGGAAVAAPAVAAGSSGVASAIPASALSTNVWGTTGAGVSASAELTRRDRLRVLNALLGLMTSFEKEYRTRLGVTMKLNLSSESAAAFLNGNASRESSAGTVDIDPRECFTATGNSSFLVLLLSAFAQVGRAAASGENTSAVDSSRRRQPLNQIGEVIKQCLLTGTNAAAQNASARPSPDASPSQTSRASGGRPKAKAGASASRGTTSRAAVGAGASATAPGAAELIEFVISNTARYDPSLIDGLRCLMSSPPLTRFQRSSEAFAAEKLLQSVHVFLQNAIKTHADAMDFLAQRARIAKGTREELEEKHWSQLPLIPTLDELRDERLGNLPIVPEVSVDRTTSDQRGSGRMDQGGAADAASSAAETTLKTTGRPGLRGFRDYEHYMNTTLRLLRQDTFSSLRMGVSRYARSKTVDFGLMRMYAPKFVGLHFRDQDTISIVLQVDPLTDTKTKQKEKNWADSGGMMYGNLIVISLDGDFQDESRLVYAQVSWSEKQVLARMGLFFAEILPRDITGAEKTPVEQVISLIAALPSWDKGNKNAARNGASYEKSAVIAESPSYYKAFWPGLRCLQTKKKIDDLPSFAPQLIFGPGYNCAHLGAASAGGEAAAGREAPAAFYLQQWPGATVDIGLLDARPGAGAATTAATPTTSGATPAVEAQPLFTSHRMRVDECAPVLLRSREAAASSEQSSQPHGIATALDEFQQHAVGVVLSNPVACIQGAPGCGKSYLAVLLIRLLASLRTNVGAPIKLKFLVVTYKNKALNELAEALLKYFPESLVRVGSGGTAEDSSELLESRNLNLLKNAYQQTAESQAFNEEWKKADKRLDGVSTEMEELSKRLGKSRFFSITLFILRSRDNQLESLLRGACEKGIPLAAKVLGGRGLANDMEELDAQLSRAHEWVSNQRQRRNKDLRLANFLDCETEFLSQNSDQYTRQILYHALADALDKWVPEQSVFLAVAECVRRHRIEKSMRLDLRTDSTLKNLVVEIRQGNLRRQMRNEGRDEAPGGEMLGEGRVVAGGAGAAEDDPEIAPDADYRREGGELLDNTSFNFTSAGGGRGKEQSFKSWADHKQHVVFLDDPDEESTATNYRAARNQHDQHQDAIRHAPEVAEYFHGRRESLSKARDLWSLEKTDRVLLVQFFLQERVDEIEHSLIAREREYTQLKVERKKIAAEQRAAVFRGNQITVTTITGAAIYADSLEKANFDVVVVEEAAEVLEGQLIACLQKSVKHLIMIGDHYQLPPPVQSSVLRERYGFGKSLMQEMIDLKEKAELQLGAFWQDDESGGGGRGNSIFSYSAQLMKQSRMDPDIAKYLRAACSGGKWRDGKILLESATASTSASSTVFLMNANPKNQHQVQEMQSRQLQNGQLPQASSASSSCTGLSEIVANPGAAGSTSGTLHDLQALHIYRIARYPKLRDNTDIVGRFRREHLRWIANPDKRDSAFIEDFLVHAPAFFWDTPLKKTDKFAWHETKQELSFINEEEAKRAVQLFLLMVSQGIRPEKITITSPYRAQIREIRIQLRIVKEKRREYLKEAWKGVRDGWNDENAALATMDDQQLRRNDYSSPQDDYNGNQERNMTDDPLASSPLLTCFDDVVCTPLDGYQGNQNDHVILSLVRSNIHHDCGFLKKSPEGICRRTVAQSRMRKSWIILGNAECFGFDRVGAAGGRNRRAGAWANGGGGGTTTGLKTPNPVWGPGLIDLMRDDGRVAASLKLKCPRHSPADDADDGYFAPTCADDLCDPVLQQPGVDLRMKMICNRVCGQTMPDPCGHACQRKCHFGPCEPRFCTERVTTSCPVDPDNHPPLSRACNERHAVCRAPVEYFCQKRIVTLEGVVGPAANGRLVQQRRTARTCGARRIRECYQGENFLAPPHMVTHTCPTPGCNWSIEAECDAAPEDLRCNRPVSIRLPTCGHTREVKCWESSHADRDMMIKCNELVRDRCASGKHHITLPCHVWTKARNNREFFHSLCKVEIPFTCGTCNREQRQLCCQASEAGGSTAGATAHGQSQCGYPCEKKCPSGLHRCYGACGDPSHECVAEAGNCRECNEDELQAQIDAIFHTGREVRQRRLHLMSNRKKLSQLKQVSLGQLFFPESRVYDLWLSGAGESARAETLDAKVQQIRAIARGEDGGRSTSGARGRATATGSNISGGEQRLLQLLPQELNVVALEFGRCVAMDPQVLYVLRKCFGPEQRIYVNYFRTKNDYNRERRHADTMARFSGVAAAGGGGAGGAVVSAANQQSRGPADHSVPDVFRLIVPDEDDLYEFEMVTQRPLPRSMLPVGFSAELLTGGQQSGELSLSSQRDYKYAIFDSGNILHYHELAALRVVGPSSATIQHRRMNYVYLLYAFRSWIARYPRCRVVIPMYREKADELKRDHGHILNQLLQLEEKRCRDAQVQTRGESELIVVVSRNEDVDVRCLNLVEEWVEKQRNFAQQMGEMRSDDQLFNSVGVLTNDAFRDHRERFAEMGERFSSLLVTFTVVPEEGKVLWTS